MKGGPFAMRAASLRLFGFAPGGVYLAQRISSTAGELLPRLFTLTCCQAVYFCGTCHRIGFPYAYSPLQRVTLLFGVRTFLPQTNCERLTTPTMRKWGLLVTKGCDRNWGSVR